jgi:hypothetical protein
MSGPEGLEDQVAKKSAGANHCFLECVPTNGRNKSEEPTDNGRCQ